LNQEVFISVAVLTRFAIIISDALGFMAPTQADILAFRPIFPLGGWPLGGWDLKPTGSRSR